MHRRSTRTFRIGAIVLLLCITVPLVAHYRSNPDIRKFSATVNAIAVDFRGWLGKQVGFSTSPLEEHLLGPSVTSEDVNYHVVLAYEALANGFEPEPVTYFATPASMPTQETIWQFQDYFVRLYVTSSLDCDGAEVGVFEGSYADFRHPEADFRPIEFMPPARFLADR